MLFRSMEVLRAVTATPAKLMGMEGKIGTLKTGACADISILKIREKPFVLTDFYGGSMECQNLLIPMATLLGGEIAFCRMDMIF